VLCAPSPGVDLMMAAPVRSRALLRFDGESSEPALITSTRPPAAP